MIQLTLPWPPSLNRYYRRVGPRTLISKAGRQYRKTVVAMCRGLFDTAITDRLSIIIYAHPPDRRRRDLDNTLKATFDSLMHAGVYEDDSQIDHFAISRCNVVPSGRLRITISTTPEIPCS